MSVQNNGDDKSLIQIAFPQQANVIFCTATILGLALIGLPTIFRSHFALNGTQSNLVVCLGAALVLWSAAFLPYGMAAAAGAMLYVVVEELIPETVRSGTIDIATLGFLTGFIVMMTLDNSFA